MIAFFANLFGILLNFLYDIIQNYGLAIILFSIIVKIILLPISIKQQKTMKKSAKIQDELKTIQFRNKNNPEALQKETMELYKRENMSPFSGCLSAIIQIILLLSVFYMVRSPLTYMKKTANQPYFKENNNYSRVENTINQNTVSNEENNNEENNNQNKTILEYYSDKISKEEPNGISNYVEIQIIEKYGLEDERVYINMDFFGLNLSSIPSKDFSDWKTYVIPVLYVITTFLSMKLTTQSSKNKKNNETGEENKEEIDMMAQTSKNMTYMMPIIAVSVSFIAPLGLALYWLTNNILMISERLILNKFLKEEE